ncbi:MAG TPA: thiamine phosphate synthase [Opitutaceae bacterium]
MPLDPSRYSPVMCLTRDGLGLSHAAQAARLCSAGALWIQLRMKGAAYGEWVAEATATAAVCRDYGAVLVVNDSVEVALASGADGVHLGSLDGEWRGARARIGEHRILGGTVNNMEDARRAAEAGCLDYAGVGPLRFTETKGNLSPVLGLAGVGALLAQLGKIPSWVVGGVEAADIPGLRGAGAAGVAVSSALYRDDRIEANLRAFVDGWNRVATRVPAHLSHP